MKEVDLDRNEVFRCLFCGYYDMFQSKLKQPAPWHKSWVMWVAAMYADLNTKLWESGKEKLRKEATSERS